MRGLAHRIAHGRRFRYLLVVLIVGIAVAQGIAISAPDAATNWYTYLLVAFVLLTMATLTLEVLLKMVALSPRVYRYFKDGWNAYDFLVVSFLMIGLVYQPIAPYGMLLLLVRLLRLLRRLAILQEMNTVLSTLLRSMRSLAHIAVLMGIIIYVYALVGSILFGEHDPARWGNLGASASSLFQIVTMDEWALIMRNASEAVPLAWVYFLSFVIISGFVVTNIFIAMVINTMDDDKHERLQTSESQHPKEEILQELRSTQKSLRRMEERLERFPD